MADAAGLARSCKTSCPRLIVVRGGVLAHIVPEHTRNHVGTDLTGSEKHLDKIVGRRVAAHKGHRFARGESDADYELNERVEGQLHVTMADCRTRDGTVCRKEVRQLVTGRLSTARQAVSQLFANRIRVRGGGM